VQNPPDTKTLDYTLRSISLVYDTQAAIDYVNQELQAAGCTVTAKIGQPLRAKDIAACVSKLTNLFADGHYHVDEYGIGETLRATYRKDPGVVGRVYAALSDEIPFVAETPIGIKEETGQVHPDFTRIAPEALLPLAELWANKKAFFDTEIVPAWMNYRPPEERAFRSTPQLYRSIAKAAKPLEPLLGEVAPLQLEHIGRTVYGSTGSSVIKTGETVRRIARGEPMSWDEVPVLTAFIDRKRDAPSLLPVRQLFKLVNDEWKYKRAQKKGTRDRYEYDQLRKALNRVEKLIEARNNADQMLDFDTRNHLDREILRVSELALQQVGKRGKPGSGPLGDFWEKFR